MSGRACSVPGFTKVEFNFSLHPYILYQKTSDQTSKFIGCTQQVGVICYAPWPQNMNCTNKVNCNNPAIFLLHLAHLNVGLVAPECLALRDPVGLYSLSLMHTQTYGYAYSRITQVLPRELALFLPV